MRYAIAFLSGLLLTVAMFGQSHAGCIIKSAMFKSGVSIINLEEDVTATGMADKALSIPLGLHPFEYQRLTRPFCGQERGLNVAFHETR